MTGSAFPSDNGAETARQRAKVDDLNGIAIDAQKKTPVADATGVSFQVIVLNLPRTAAAEEHRQGED
jgi:hypothetical protein